MIRAREANSRSVLHPLRWTALTWLGAALWCWQAFVTNYPPKHYSVFGPNGELIEHQTFDSLSELPFAHGWPLHYVNPTPVQLGPVRVGTPTLLPGTGPATISWEALGLNLMILGLAIACLIYCSQKLLPRFSILAILSLTAFLAIYIKVSPWIAIQFGFQYSSLLFHCIYFGWIPLAIAIRSGALVDWGRVRDGFLFATLRPASDYDSASECLAAASKLEQDGDWDRAVEVFQMVAEKWPDHEAFVKNCIARIDEKRAT